MDFLAGIVVGAIVAALLGGPAATRVSAWLEARWDRESARTDGRGLEAMVDRLAGDETLFAAYQRQYWTWAAVVGGGIVGIAAAGALITWTLSLSGSRTAAAAVAAATAVVAGAATMFWVRKLIKKRRVVRRVYLGRLADDQA